MSLVDGMHGHGPGGRESHSGVTVAEIVGAGGDGGEDSEVSN